jgi:hypothetical protein
VTQSTSVDIYVQPRTGKTEISAQHPVPAAHAILNDTELEKLALDARWCCVGP